jgi:hypothetical protein
VDRLWLSAPHKGDWRMHIETLFLALSGGSMMDVELFFVNG